MADNTNQNLDENTNSGEQPVVPEAPETPEPPTLDENVELGTEEEGTPIPTTELSPEQLASQKNQLLKDLEGVLPGTPQLSDIEQTPPAPPAQQPPEPTPPRVTSSVVDTTNKHTPKTFAEYAAAHSDQPQIPTFNEVSEEERKKAIRTYQSDVAETMRTHSVSLTDIAIAEQRKKVAAEAAILAAQQPQTQINEHVPPPVTQPPQTTVAYTPPPAPQTTAVRTTPPAPPVVTEHTPVPWKTILMYTLGTILIVAGLGGLGFLGVTFFKPVATTTPRELPNSLIFSENFVGLSVDGLSSDALANALADAATRERRTELPGSIVTLNLTTNTGAEQERLITTPELLAQLEARVDPALLRSIQNAFQYGVHVFDKPFPFLVIRTTFFDNAFSGMLRWEPLMPEDLDFLVRTDLDTPAATTTPVTTDDLIGQPSGFTDLVVANRDTRALLNEHGDIVLLYSFFDQNTVVITNNSDTLAELVERLSVARFER